MAEPVTALPDVRADDRVRVCALLAVPVVVASGVPATQFAHWSWICLTLAAPVVAWGGFPWLRRAARALRGGSCADDVPVLLGTAGALAWSVAALMLGPAGVPGWTQPVVPDPASGPPVRLDVAAGVTLAVLAAGMLGARPPMTPGIARRAVVPAVLAVAAGALGYRLGAGYDAGTAASAAIATLLVAAPVVFDVRAPVRPPDPRTIARRVDTVLFTRRALTAGPRQLAAVHPAAGTDPAEVLRLAGSVAEPSDHPAARAVAAAAAERGGIPDVAEFDERAGLGVSGLVAELRNAGDGGAGDGAPASGTSDGNEQVPGVVTDEPEARRHGRPQASGTDGPDLTVVAHAVLVGHPDLLGEHDIALPADLERARRAAEESGQAVVAVAWDGHARAVLALTADPASDAVAAVRSVRRTGLVTALPPGPIGAAVLAACADTGASVADVRPGGEGEAVAGLRAGGRVVAVVGTAGRDDDALGVADLALAVGAPHAHAGAREAVRALRRLRRAVGPVPWTTLGAVAYHLVALWAAASGALDPLLAGLAGAVVTAVVLRRCSGPPDTVGASSRPAA